MENCSSWDPFIAALLLGKETQFCSELSLESAMDSQTNKDEGFWSPADESTFFFDEDSLNAGSSFDEERDMGKLTLVERAAYAALKKRRRKLPPVQRLQKAKSVPVLSHRPAVTRNCEKEESFLERSQENPLENGGLIADISERIGTSWRRLGSKLGLETFILDNIGDENKKNEGRASEVLTTWSRREGNLPDMGKLSRSLENIGRKDVAEILQRSTECRKHCNYEEQLNLCVKRARGTKQAENMICEDKETGRFFLVKEVDRSSFFDGTLQGVDEELEDLHQRFTTTKLCQEYGYSKTSTNGDSSLNPIQEVDDEPLDVSIQLAACEKLNNTLDNICNNLVTLVGEIWNDANSRVRKAVYEFADRLNTEHNDLLQTLQELSTKPLSHGENEKWLHCLQEMHGKWTQKSEQLERCFSSIFFQEIEMRPRSCAVNPREKRKRSQNEPAESGREGSHDELKVVQHISPPFMVQRTVALPRNKRSK